MPLPDDFFDEPIGTTPTGGYARDIFPDFGEEDVAERGSAYDAIGEALWSAESTSLPASSSCKYKTVI